MRVSALPRVLAAAVMATTLVAQSAAIATIQLAPNARATGHMFADLDRDGRDDLVLACRDDAAGGRWLQVHLHTASGPAYESRPSRNEPVDRDVVAFTFADLGPGRGAELVLFTNEQAVLVTGEADDSARYRRLLRHRLVWPAADPSQVVPLPDSVLDYDQDGDADLLLPRPDGWSVWLQQTGTFGAPLELELPRHRSRFARFTGGRSDGESDGGPAAALGFGRRQSDLPLVRAAARTPQCHRIDVDGNGFVDLVTYRNGTCFIGSQNAAGELVRRELAVPLPEDRLQLLDPAFDVQVVDLDADGRADLLLTTSTSRDGELEARVDWHLAQPDGTWATKRAGRLRLQPLAFAPRLVDADGDGHRDLVCVSVRTSAMQAINGDAVTALDGQLSIFAGDGAGGFARPALVNRPLPLRPGSGGASEPFLIVRPRARDADVPSEVLLLAEGRLERRPLARRGNRLRLGAGEAGVPLPEDARIVTRTDHPDELLLLTDGEVRHVRLRR